MLDVAPDGGVDRLEGGLDHVTSHARPSGPCSACTTTSMAAHSGGTVSSATTTTSDGPANAAGTPTTPRTSSWAMDTQRLPARR